MQDYPHHYHATAAGGPDGDIATTSPGLVTISSQSPPEFGGPEGKWSPETLLVASVVDCFILTFRAIARASRFEWHHLDCVGEGILERVDRVTRFTGFRLKVTLQVPPGAREDRALRLLDKAEQICLITNSLNGTVELEAKVVELGEHQAA